MPNLSASPTAQVVHLFPAPRAATQAAPKIQDRNNLTSAELRAVREAVIRLPLPWFKACEDRPVDADRGRHRYFSHVRQVAGPFIANFTITRNGTDFTVRLDDGQHATDEWDGFLSIADAVAVIGYYVEWVLIGWGLQVA